MPQSEHHEQATTLHTFLFFIFLAEVFVDKDSDSDVDVADSLSNLSEQVCRTGRQDTVEMTDNSDFQILFDAENTAVIPEIFLSSSFNDC